MRTPLGSPEHRPSCKLVTSGGSTGASVANGKDMMLSCARNVLAITAVALFIAASDVRAAELCWIDRVERTEDGVRVFHRSGYLNGIKRADGRVERGGVSGGGPQWPRFFDLLEGDSASLTNTLHDWCTVKAERRDDVLGVQVDATSRPHGLPATRASRFLPGY